MRRLNLLSLLCVLTTVLLAAACQTGGGYGRYSGSQPAADLPPSSLSDAQAAALAAPATEQPASPAPAIDLPPVKVAILLPLSGRNAGLGQAMLNAAQIALFDAGEANFELLPVDTGTAAAEAASAALRQGAQLILGPVFAEEVRAVKPVAAQAGVNVIAFSTDWSLAGGNTFIMGFLPFDQVDRVTAFAASRGVARMGVLAPQSEYGRAVTTAFNAAAQRYGLAVAGSAAIPADSTGVESAVAQLAGATPSTPQTPAPFDAVLMPLGGDSAAAAARALSAAGLAPSSVRRIGTGLFDDPALIRNAADLEGAWFAAPSPNGRGNFERRYTSTYGANPPRLSSLAYDATALAAVLARTAQPGVRVFDRAAITSPNGFAGIDGIFRFRADGTAERGLAVLELGRGGVRVIDEAPRTFQKPLPPGGSRPAL